MDHDEYLSQPPEPKAKKKRAPKGEPEATAVEITGEVIAEVKDGQIVAFSATELALTDLRAKYGDPSKFIVTTAEGLIEGKAAVNEMVTYRTSLEKKRKELKAPVLERGRLIDAEAARITAALQAIEIPLAAHVQAEVDRLAEIQAEADRKESDRVEAIQSRLQRIREAPLALVGATPEKLKAVRDSLESVILSEFQEFDRAASSYREAAVDKINAMISGAEEAERQQKLFDEQRRIAEIKTAISAVSGLPATLIGMDLTALMAAHANLSNQELTWASEFSFEAESAKSSSLMKINSLIHAEENKKARDDEMELMRAQLKALTIPVHSYEDSASGEILEEPDGKQIDLVEAITTIDKSESNRSEHTVIATVSYSDNQPQSVTEIVEIRQGENPTEIGAKEIIAAIVKVYEIDYIDAAKACHAAFGGKSQQPMGL